MENKLAIVVGHMKTAKGADSVAPLSTPEYDYNKDIAERIFRLAKEKNIDCRIFFRDIVGISGAYREVNKWATGKAACIELHFNSANTKAQGTETLYDSEPASSQLFAKLVQKQMCAVFSRTGKQDRGTKHLTDGDRGYYNLEACTVPSCIVEPFFGDNREDAELGHSLRQAYAAALVTAAEEFFS